MDLAITWAHCQQHHAHPLLKVEPSVRPRLGYHIGTPPAAFRSSHTESAAVHIFLKRSQLQTARTAKTWRGRAIMQHRGPGPETIYCKKPTKSAAAKRGRPRTLQFFIFLKSRTGADVHFTTRNAADVRPGSGELQSFKRKE